MSKKPQQKSMDSGLSFDVGADAPVATEAPAKAPRPAQVEIEASALMPGIECPFTDGCTGRIKIHSDITTTKEVNDQIVKTRIHQYRCNKCGVLAKGVREVSKSEGRKLFNRFTGKTE